MDRRPMRRRPSPALVIATVALVASLTGTAVAASLSNNQVRSQHIANGQVKRSDIAVNAIDSPLVRDGALIGADIQNGTIGTSDVRDDSLKGADIAHGSLAGAEIADNSLTGDDVDETTLRGLMPSQVRVVVAESGGVASGAAETVVATCAANERALGGGAAWVLPSGEPSAGAAMISASMPEPGTGLGDLTGWRAAGRNESGGPLVLRSYAFCSVRA